MLPVEFFVLVLYPPFAAFVWRTELCVRPKLVDFVLHVRHVFEIPGVHIKKAIAFLDRQIETWEMFRNALQDLPVVFSGCTRFSFSKSAGPAMHTFENFLAVQ